jgi:hypothetical protein
VSKFCECGCGTKTKYNRQKKCYNKFAPGHNAKIKPPMLGRKGDDNPLYKRSLSEKHKQSLSDNHADFSKEKHPFWNKHHSEITKEMISETLRGRILPEETKQKMRDNSAQRGKSPPFGTGWGKHSICDAGYEVRSLYERLVSDWLYNHNIKHSYEFKRFFFEDGTSYLPDYYIPELNLWIEVKGLMAPKDRLQIELFKNAGYNLLVLDKSFFQCTKLYEGKLMEVFCGNIL